MKDYFWEYNEGLWIELPCKGESASHAHGSHTHMMIVSIGQHGIDIQGYYYHMVTTYNHMVTIIRGLLFPYGY